jgi:hypothetical protein
VERFRRLNEATAVRGLGIGATDEQAASIPGAVLSAMTAMVNAQLLGTGSFTHCAGHVIIANPKSERRHRAPVTCS